jgi:hypothetical protein
MVLPSSVFLMIGVRPIDAQNSFDPVVAQDLQALIDNAVEQDNPGVVLWVVQLIASQFEFRERGHHEIEIAKS